MAFQFNLYGGATRPDAISGLDPAFVSALEQMVMSAPPEMQSRLGIGSGFRSVERQRQLWENSDKSGKMVARPGHSQHNHGRAVDLYGDGVRLDKAGADVRDWVHSNAPKFGLSFPMSYEPWHIEPAGARGKGQRPAMAGGGGNDAGGANALVPPAAPAASAPGVGGGEGQGGSGIAKLFANLAPEPVSQPGMIGGGVGEEFAPAVFGAGDPMGATMSAMQGAQSAGDLARGLMPDIGALMGMGKKRVV